MKDTKKKATPKASATLLPEMVAIADGENGGEA